MRHILIDSQRPTAPTHGNQVHRHARARELAGSRSLLGGSILSPSGEHAFDRTRESFNCAAGGKYFNANDKHNLQNRTTPDISPALRAHSFARWPRASLVSEDNRNGRTRQPVTKASRQTAPGEVVC